MNTIPAEPTESEIQEAKHFPNGWIYRTELAYTRGEYIPPTAIIGAWKVDADGKIVGDFIPNPNYKPQKGSGDSTTAPNGSAGRGA